MGRAARAALAAALACGLAAALPQSRAQAAEDCLLVTELDSGRVLAKQGLCASRHSPASTFKIPLALMGFDAGLLKDPRSPVLVTEPGLQEATGARAGPQTPESWMRLSVVWFSQVLARKLGAERFAAYVRAFGYGNGNVSGDPGRDDGFTRAWLSSSLRISPREQVDFLRRMLKGELPVPPRAITETLRLIAQDAQPAGWQLYGKTGSGELRGADGASDPSRPFGWFVGAAQKEGRTVVFARFIALDTPAAEPLGLIARTQALKALGTLLATPGL